MRKIPDTSLLREARAVVEAAAPQSIVNHSLRTFLLGAAYGAKEARRFDEEGLALAAVFHDLGLCDGHRDARAAFQLSSSRELRTFLEARAVAPGRITPLCEAIEFHMQLRPRWDKGSEAGLLQVGAWMDLARLRRRSLGDEAAEVERAFPRAGIDLQFPRLLLGSIRSVPACLGLFAPERYRDGR